MVIPPVYRGHNGNATRRLRQPQWGISLIELMLAMSLNLLILASVGSVFISGQKLITDKGKQLLLMQELSGALRYIKDDIRRAGYIPDQDRSLMQKGTHHVVQTGTQMLSYVYHNADGQYEQVSVKENINSNRQKVLGLCINTQSSLPHISDCSRYFSLLDQSRVRLTDLQIESVASVTAQPLIRIRLSAELSEEHRVQRTLLVSVQPRNGS